MAANDHLNPQQFYHGTDHEFKPGELVIPGFEGNRESVSSPEHAYATLSLDQAKHFGRQAAEGAMRKQTGWVTPVDARVYHVEPTGPMERDLDEGAAAEGAAMTRHPLRVVREVWRESP